MGPRLCAAKLKSPIDYAVSMLVGRKGTETSVSVQEYFPLTLATYRAVLRLQPRQSDYSVHIVLGIDQRSSCNGKPIHSDHNGKDRYSAK